MKKALLIISLTALFAVTGLTMAYAQDSQTKDTVNMDTEAVPTFYYDVEDEKAAADKEKGSGGTVAIIIGAVVVIGAAAYFMMKKKK